jgi:hypothetical protein
MLRNLLMALVAAFLTFCFVSAARAAYFTDLSAMPSLNYYQACPCGVNSNGVVSMQGASSRVSSNFDTYAYTGGSAGTVTDLYSLFSSDGYSFDQMFASPMNASGQMAIDASSTGAGRGFLYSGGTSGTVTAYQVGSYGTFSLAIDKAGDEGGFYMNESSGAPYYPYVYAGGSVYALNRPAAGPYTAYGAGIVAMNTNGQAVGFNAPGNPPEIHASVWTYTLSGGSVASQTAADLQNSVTAQYPTALASTFVAINSSGTAVGQWSATNVSAIGLGSEGGAFMYNVDTSTFTSLGGLMIGLKNGENFTWGSGFQAINDSGEVAGCIVNTANTGGAGSSTLSGYDAAVWKNGTITDLNTLYAPALAATGFVLDNATAIDDNGDIAGYGHDANGHVEQAFLLAALLPGDAIEDGKVDINDLTIVLAHYGQSAGASWSTGDFLGDGKVDINDLTIVLAHYGQSVGAAAAGVAPAPEPSGLVMLLAMFLAPAWPAVRRCACGRR